MIISLSPRFFFTYCLAINLVLIPLIKFFLILAFINDSNSTNIITIGNSSKYTMYKIICYYFASEPIGSQGFSSLGFLSNIASISFDKYFPITSSLTMFDIDNDNDLELLVGSANSLLNFDVKSNGSVENYWSIYKGNNKRSSYFILECVSMDVTNDGIINVLDVISIVNFIISNIPVNECSADTNNDGIINVVDIVAIVNMILDD